MGYKICPQTVKISVPLNIQDSEGDILMDKTKFNITKHKKHLVDHTSDKGDVRFFIIDVKRGSSIELPQAPIGWEDINRESTRSLCEAFGFPDCLIVDGEVKGPPFPERLRSTFDTGDGFAHFWSPAGAWDAMGGNKPPTPGWPERKSDMDGCRGIFIWTLISGILITLFILWLKR